MLINEILSLVNTQLDGKYIKSNSFNGGGSYTNFTTILDLCKYILANYKLPYTLTKDSGQTFTDSPFKDTKEFTLTLLGTKARCFVILSYYSYGAYYHFSRDLYVDHWINEWHELETITEIGSNYVRYASGVQICFDGNATYPNDNTNNQFVTFPKSFSSNVSVICQSTNPYVNGIMYGWVNNQGFTVTSKGDYTFSYIAVGKWR